MPSNADKYHFEWRGEKGRSGRETMEFWFQNGIISADDVADMFAVIRHGHDNRHDYVIEFRESVTRVKAGTLIALAREIRKLRQKDSDIQFRFVRPPQLAKMLANLNPELTFDTVRSAKKSIADHKP